MWDGFNNGKVLKYGDNVDADVILPGKNLTIMDPYKLAEHAVEGLDPSFLKKVKEGGRILGAGKNFGCGSSREQAPIALKHAGIICILAESFARIFYRNAINIGLPILECEGISEKVREGELLAIDLESGVIKNQLRGKEYRQSHYRNSS